MNLIARIIAGLTISAMIFGAGIGFNRVLNTSGIDNALQSVEKATETVRKYEKMTTDQYNADIDAVQKIIDYTKGLERQIDEANSKIAELNNATDKLNSLLDSYSNNGNGNGNSNGNGNGNGNGNN